MVHNLAHEQATPTTDLSSTHLAVPADEDRVALDVSMDDPLRVEVVKSLQATLTDGGYLLLTETGERERGREEDEHNIIRNNIMVYTRIVP